MSETKNTSRYRMIISEYCNPSEAPFIWTWTGTISKYITTIDKWEVIYTHDYWYKFTAYIGLSKMLRTLKKWDRIKEKKGISLK